MQWMINLIHNTKMKIYLLVLVLAVLAQSKFRNQRNLTITVPSPPSIKCLTSTEFAYQCQDTITTFDSSTNKSLQTIKQKKSSPVQLIPSSNMLVYPDGSDIVQVRSNAKAGEFQFKINEDSWVPPIGASGSTVVAAVYGQAGEERQLMIFGPSPKNLTWKGFAGENVNGGSGVSVVNANAFYFAAGGTCVDGKGVIYLQGGNSTGIENKFNFTVSGCNFGDLNKQWTLQSYQFNKIDYHLLTYAASAKFPKRYTSELISNAGGAYQQVIHFDVERLIGAGVISDSVIYTADNMLCRVLEHDIQNHQHQHKQTSFNFPMKSTFLTPSEKFLVVLGTQSSTRIQALVFTVDENKQFTSMEIYVPKGNTLRAQLMADNYLFTKTDYLNSPLTIFDRSQLDILPSNISGVVDLCVSNLDILFIAQQVGSEQTLTAYSMIGSVLTAVSDTVPLAFDVQSISCLDNNHILLNPNGNSIINIWKYNDADKKVEPRSQMVKNITIHTYFSSASDVLIFTNKFSNSSLFYDYDFKPLDLSFNLPASSQYSIIQANNGGILLALGDDITHFASLEYYQNEKSAITYKGTFPYFDDGEADIVKTVLLPKTKALHIEYSAGSDEWSTYFDLDSPPLKSIGYFYDANQQCSDFSDAIFHTNYDGSKNLIVLNKNNPSLEKYSIGDNKLTNVYSEVLPYTAVDYLSLKQSSNPNEIIISGVKTNLNYSIEVRNINLLSKVLFSKEELSVIKLQTRSVEIADGLVVSTFTDEKLDIFDIFFYANTNTPIAAGTDIFTAITLISTCPNCSLIAFTGDLKTAATGTTIVVQDYQNPSNSQSVNIDCKINLLALSPSGTQIAYNCENNTLFVLVLKNNIPSEIKWTYKSLADLAFLSEYTLIVNMDGVLKYIPIIFLNGGKPEERKAATTSYAVDYNKQIYAVAVSPTTIQINTLNGTLIDTITLNNNNQIASLSFNSNDDLYIATTNGTIIILTQLPCPTIDQQLVNDFCLCKQLFVQSGDQCSCGYIYDNVGGNCHCDDGYYFNGGMSCNSCSAMCSTCSSGDAFDCSDFSVWFFLIIIAIILIVAGGVLFAVFKLKKKPKQETMYTEEKTKLTEQFISEKEEKSSEDGNSRWAPRNKTDE